MLVYLPNRNTGRKDVNKLISRSFVKGAYWIGSNSSFIQYCDSNIGLFSIAPPFITIWEAKQKRSHEPIYKTYTKIEAKGLRATTLLSQSWKSDN